MTVSLLNTVIDSCSSTNDLAREAASAGAPHGAWISARRQTAGRGRQGRVWQSLEGNLLLSIVARVTQSRVLSWVPLVTGLVCARELREHGVLIKWPNDLWIRRPSGFAKVGGILCEGMTSAQGSAVVIGIGINCAHAPKPDPSFLVPGAVLGVSADALRERLVAAVPAAISELEEEGAGHFSREFEAWSALPAGTLTNYGTVMGLGPSGELRVRDSHGIERELLSEEVKIAPR